MGKNDTPAEDVIEPKEIEFTLGDGTVKTFVVNPDMIPHLNWVPAGEGKKSQAEVFASFASQLNFENSTQVLEDPDLLKRWKEIVLNEGAADEQRFMSVRDLMNRMNARVRDNQNDHTVALMKAEDREATDDQLALAVSLKRQCDDIGLTGMSEALGKAIGVVDGADMFRLNGRALKLIQANRASESRTTGTTTQGAPTKEPSASTTPTATGEEPF
jgi:hypothetical protein